jgi:preprotein translocase subunit SecY
LKNFWNIFRIAELKQKLGFTLFILIIFRLGGFIPVAGIDITRLAEIVKTSEGIGGLLKYLDVFSGNALSQCMIFALGISPYIMASILMQLLTMTIPYLEALSKEGEFGRKVINQYTRYLALGLSVAQGSVFLSFLEFYQLVLTPGIGFRLFFLFTIVTGAMIVMWLGEQISLHGLGSGSSVLIFASIVARLPHDVARTIDAVASDSISLFTALFILALFLGVGACIVFLEKGERKIPVQYARRIVGQRVYGGQSSYIPFKLNPAGVMPAIMTSSALQIPRFIIGALSSRIPALQGVVAALHTKGFLFNSLTFALIVFFTYIYTAVIFNPLELADNLKKGGGFIVGVRPGRQTAEYFDYLLNRMGLVGALYLGVLVLIPNALEALIPNMPFQLGGTSLLILVGVALELAAQTESYLIEQRYGSFLSSGRVKSRSI